MRVPVLACLATIGALCSVSPAASASTKLLVKTRTYEISGTTGAALVEAMDRNGPKHGFMTRAIADTAYTVNWDLAMSRTDGVCHLRQADGVLDLTYTYPRLAQPADARLERRWKRFFAGVRAHEETHGRIARSMMKATERSIRGLKRTDNWFCTGTRQEARRRINAVYVEYEAKQKAFDAREHRDGGHVEHLVDALIKP